jgi:histidinol-phosphate aminotransferase
MLQQFNIDQRFLDNINPAVRKMGPYTVSGGQVAEIKLNQNENPYDLPDWFKRKILDEFYNESWNRYPQLLPKEAIKRYAAFLGVPEECVIMGNGSNELLYTIFLTTLWRGASVLIPSPSFSLYETIADILGADVLKVAMTAELEFQVDAIIEEAKRSRPNLVIISTPNNPTSKSISYEEIERIVSEAKGIVLVDEAYIEFSRQRSVLDLIYDHSNLVVLRTMSKAFSLAGLRVGFAISNPALMSEIMKPKIPFASNRLAEITLINLLDNYQMVEESVRVILNERDRVSGALRKMSGLKLHDSDTNFFIIEVSDPKRLFETLQGKGILVRNVSGYPMMEKCLRVNVGTPVENDRFLFEIEKSLT